MRLVRDGVAKRLGSVNELLDMTPYQLLRFLGADPKPRSKTSALDKLKKGRYADE